MSQDNYDVVVIGSGVGGMVCANYLALRGLKTVVFEKNKEVGGYCTSFKRRGFTIDTTIHAIQNCEQGNVLNRIFQELNLENKIEITRTNPTDTIITANHKIHISNNLEETIYNFQSGFPEEMEAIHEFFKLVASTNFLSIFQKYKRMTFREVLNLFFNDECLKGIFGLFLGNIGSVPENTSAVCAFALLKQFILAGGYYPKGGVQSIPDALARNLIEMGGKVVLNTRIDEIVVEQDCAIGVCDENKNFYKAKVVISNADLTYVFNNLLKTEMSETNEIISARRLLADRRPSLSIFIAYVIMNKSYKNFESGPGIWYLPNEGEFFGASLGDLNNVFNHKGMFCSISSKLDESLMPKDTDIIRLMTSTPHFGADEWAKIAKSTTNILVDQIAKILPNFKNHVVCVGRGTSLTMKNYTLNRDGAVAGWLNSVEQMNDPITAYLPKISGLYFVGHWITQPYGNGGIAMAADCGRRTAKIILKEEVVTYG